MSESRATCPACQTDQLLKTDGTFRKHTTADGSTCSGSGQPPAADAAEAVAAASEPDEAAATAAGEAETPGEFRWQMTVRSPAIYLPDPEWHQANGLAAVAAAERAGRTVTGEAQWAGDSGGGAEEGTVLLTYLVPVEPT